MTMDTRSEVTHRWTTGDPTVCSLADAWTALVTNSDTSSSAVSDRSARPHSRAITRTCPRAKLGAVGRAANGNRVCNGHAGDGAVITLPIGATWRLASVRRRSVV